MKTKDKGFAKKIKLDKMKIATLSRDQKRQVSGGCELELTWTWVLCCVDPIEELNSVSC
ncbi:class I lanthipeptide [uncultured Aquimarina sp.]|uniref:class I lanthipeptide n=1 Tax=uncultured Aquimarina sp. TaxID=575652 RepID=UPI00261F3C4D|nr:class I lanthipeptide [uncultured Aquimarina sp.]